MKHEVENSNYPYIVAIFIRERKKLGLSHEQLHEITKTNVSRFESNGYNHMYYKTKELYAQSLHVVGVLTIHHK